MADTVMARVGTDRQVTRSEFLRAWSKVAPPARPDSLTPESARRFLDLLIGREALGARALRERFTWSREESLKYQGLKDRLPLQAALEQSLRDVQERMLASGDTVTNREALGVAARESLITHTDLRWNEPALEKMAKAFDAIPKPSRDSSMMTQIRMLGALPVVEESEKRAELVRAGDQPFTVRELIEAWGRLNPLERPRVSTAEQVRDLVKNAVFERHLRAEATRRRLAERPDIAAALAREREFYAVEHLVAREVYAKIDTTTTPLRAFYSAHETDFGLPTRVVLTRLVLPDRAGANAMAVKLADAAETESLVVKAARRGLRYRGEIGEATDSVLFRRAMSGGPGAVLGPDSTASGWSVSRVGEIRPARPRSFEEARSLVGQRWYGEEGERLMVDLLDGSKRSTRVVVNPRGFDFIKSGSSSVRKP